MNKKELKNRLNGVVNDLLEDADMGYSESLCHTLVGNGLNYLLKDFQNFLISEKILSNNNLTIKGAYFMYDLIECATTFRFMVLIEYAKTLGVEL